jgi:hypothetical protein
MAPLILQLGQCSHGLTEFELRLCPPSPSPSPRLLYIPPTSHGSFGTRP